MSIRGISTILLIGFFFQQCAKQTSPTGGPADEIPPKLESSNPRHEQVDVKPSKIELQFSEAIQLNNPKEQIIITPRIGKNFETTSRKNKVTLDLKADLQENTTYSINFREAIQDLTEKNPATVKLAFSTGPYIDSLSINGSVQDALSEKKLNNYTVALAEASDTFNIFRHTASWITLTDKKGSFQLENLKPGKYILYAFNDRNKNVIVDSKSEEYGFIGNPIDLTNNIDSLSIRTLKLDVNKLKLITARTTFAYFNLRFSKSLTKYTVTAIDSTLKVYSTLEPDLSTIKLYNTIPQLDSLQITVQATDSLNHTMDTVLYMKFPKKEATRDKLNAKIENAIVTENSSALSAQVTFSKPITGFNPDSMFIEIDSLTRIPFTKNEYAWENNLTRLYIKKINLHTLFPPDTSTADKAKASTPAKQNPKKSTSLIFKKGTFISVENDTVQPLTSPITVLKTESTAIIETKVETRENFIVQIISKPDKVIDQRVNQKEAVFENLKPETYLIRVIIDLNKNGRWDPGDFLTKTEPEPVIFYRNSKGLNEIPLKANWHVGPLLITY